MAHVADGKALSREITIDASGVASRSFQFDGFSFVSTDDIAVRIGDAQQPAVERRLYRVVPNVSRNGGDVEFFDSSLVNDPVTLVAGQTLTIYRDTEVRRPTTFRQSGYAQAPAVESQLAVNDAVLEELAERTETHAELIIGEDRVTAIVGREVKPYAQVANMGPIDEDQLAQSPLVSGAVQIETVELQGRTLSMASEGGGTASFDLEGLAGIDVKSDGETVGSFGGTTRLNFTGDGVGLSDSGDGEVAVHIAGGGGTGGDTMQGGGGTPEQEVSIEVPGWASKSVNTTAPAEGPPLVNRISVTPNTGAVVASDWETIDLVEDATTAGGFTVVANEIVIPSDAPHEYINIDGTLMLQSSHSGGASRTYAHVRPKVVSAGGVTTYPAHAEFSMYNKTAAAGTLAQGPDDLALGFNFFLEVDAGDRIELQWKIYTQTSEWVQIINTDTTEPVGQQRVSQVLVTTGMGVPFEQSFTIPEVPAGGGGGGGGQLTTAQLAALARTAVNAREIRDLQAEADAIRKQSDLAKDEPATLTQTDTFVELAGAMDVPPNEEDAELVFTVTSPGIDPATDKRFKVAELRALPTVAAGGTPSKVPGSINALLFTNAGASNNDDNEYFIGRTDTNKFVFASSEVQNYAVTIQWDRLDVTEHVHLTPAGTTNVDLGHDSNGNLQALVPAGTFPTTSDVTNSIVNDVAAAALDGNNDVWPPAKLGTGTHDATTVLHGDGTFQAAQTHELEHLDSLPGVADYSVGDIINVEGELKELVEDTDEDNVLRGVASQQAGTFIGTSAVQWNTADPSTDPTFKVYLSKSALDKLAAVPASIFGQFRDSTGFVTDVSLNRATSDPRDFSTDSNSTVYAYQAPATGTRAENNTIGLGFDMALWTDGTRATKVAIHDGDRWEDWQQRHASSANAPAPNKEQVYNLAKTIVRGGTRIDVAQDDTAETLTVSETAITSGASFPASPSDGDMFNLLRAETVHDNPVAEMEFLSDRTGSDTILRIPLAEGTAAGPRYIVAYSDMWAGDNPAQETALRGKAFVQYAGAPTLRVNRITLYEDGASETTYPVEQAGVTGFPHLSEVTGLTFAALRSGTWHRNARFTNGTKVFADRQDPIGQYTYSADTGWVLSPGLAAPWATQGQPEPVTLLAVTQLIDGPGVGISVPSPATAVRPANVALFSPLFDLDDTRNRQGIVQVEATLTIATPAAPSTTSFVSTGNAANAQRRARITGFAFASALRGTDGLYDAATGRGIEIGRVSVWRGTQSQGEVILKLARNAANQVGYFLEHPAPGGTPASTAFALSIDLEAAFLHNDRPDLSAVAAAGIPNVGYRGPRRAFTQSLPTSPKAEGSLFSNGETLWSLEGSGQSPGAHQRTGPAQAAGYEMFGGAANNDAQLLPPGNPPPGADGLWFVSKVGTREVQSVWFPWGPIGQDLATTSAAQSDAEAILFFDGGRFGSGTPAYVAIRYDAFDSGWPRIVIVGQGKTLPGLATIEVYEHGVYLTPAEG